MSDNFYELIHATQSRLAQRVAITADDDSDYTGAELIDGASRCAALLQSRGLRPGDRVVVQAEKSVQSLMFYLGCLRAGVVYAPLNTAYRQAELRHFLDDADPGMVICPPDSLDSFSALTRATLLTLDEKGHGTLANALPAADFATPVAQVQADDTAVIIYTSGTTGRSKGAMVTHRNLASNSRVLVALWGMAESDVLLHALPIFHIHGLFVANHTALIAGAQLIWQRKLDAATLIRAMPKATLLMGVPTFYTRLLAASDFQREVTRNMRLFISGSAPLLAETFSDFETRTGHRILERYGMSEAGMITSNPLIGERRAGTVGLPLPGNQVRIADDRDQPLPLGEVGGIQIKGNNVFAGYWHMPEKTAEEFTADGWFRTGDVGRFDPDGYLSIVGRAKDLIITGGYNVYPKEIEQVLDALPDITESAVIGVPHPDFGEAVTAVVVAKNAAHLVETELIAHLKTQLANYKVPKRIHVVNELPRNAMGKVQKNLLRQQYGG
ncbi:MAG: AMP-binding protein [Betaproteobacteria bacterium]|nr:AMP-binding protein [Betaproteobacteria bacterium]